MIRYCTQKNDHGCGPVAILNAMKWNNHPDYIYSYHKWYKLIAEACKTTRKGTDDEDFDKALRCYGQVHGFFVRKVRNTDMKYVRDRTQRHISEGGAIITAALGESKSSSDMHWSFWENKCCHYIKGANIYWLTMTPDVGVYDRSVLEEMWSDTIKLSDENPIVYLLKKKT